MPRYIDADLMTADIQRYLCANCSIHCNPTKVKNSACDIAECLRRADNAPTADVQEVKLGRWEYNQDVIPYWVCSECAYYVTHEYKFCPNCGAKMN